VRSFSLAGVAVDLRPLSVHQCLELRALWGTAESEPVALSLIFLHRPPEETGEEALASLVYRSLAIIFPGREDLLAAFARAAFSAGEDARAQLRDDVSRLCAWFAAEHDWPRIAKDLFQIEKIVDGVIVYRKRKGGVLGTEASHIMLAEHSSRSLFEMLRWRPEAYLSEFEGLEELLREKTNGKTVTNRGEACVTDTPDSFMRRFGGPGALKNAARPGVH
jgi:hypothetical protein